jgi:hypothetical protein
VGKFQAYQGTMNIQGSVSSEPVTHSCPTTVLWQAGWEALGPLHAGTMQLARSTCRHEGWEQEKPVGSTPGFKGGKGSHSVSGTKWPWFLVCSTSTPDHSSWWELFSD